MNLSVAFQRKANKTCGRRKHSKSTKQFRYHTAQNILWLLTAS